MLTIQYQQKNADRLALAAIDRREAFRMVVKGPKRGKLKRAALFYQTYFEKGKRESRRFSTWMKFGYYAFATPMFWAIYNHAVLADMAISFYETEDSLVVSFDPAATPAGSRPKALH